MKPAGAPTLLYQPARSQLEFADEAVYAALATRPPVFISVSHLKLGQDRRGSPRPTPPAGTSYDSLFHALLYGEKAVRAFWSPEVDRRIFAAAVPIDYARLAADCARVKPLLDRAVRARITAPGGTELELGLAGRLSSADDGDFRRPGSGGQPARRGGVHLPAAGHGPGADRLRRQPVPARTGWWRRGGRSWWRCGTGFVGGIRGGPEAGLLEAAWRRRPKQALALEREGKLARRPRRRRTRATPATWASWASA